MHVMGIKRELEHWLISHARQEDSWHEKLIAPLTIQERIL